VALNMIDVAEAMGIKIDVAGLAKRLGCPVVLVVSTEGKGIGELKQAICAAVANPPVPTAKITYAPSLGQAITALLPAVNAIGTSRGADPRWLAPRLLEGDDLARAIVDGRVEDETLARLREGLADDVDILLADGRYGFANRITQEMVSRKSRLSRSLSDRIDRVILNRLLGIPIFLAVMYLMCMWTINIGGAFIDFFNQFTGTLTVDGFASLLKGLISPEWLTVLLAKGIGGGIQVSRGPSCLRSAPSPLRPGAWPRMASATT
jgi:ferrous iron transport protein B